MDDESVECVCGAPLPVWRPGTARGGHWCAELDRLVAEADDEVDV